MKDWNKQLKRIIWRTLGRENAPPEDLNPLFKSISDAFDSHEKEYSLLNRIMDLSSEELFEANAQLRKRNEELDRFMYSASHDLRAPLTSIMGLLQLIKLENDEEVKNRYLDLMDVSTVQLDNFIQDLVAFTHNKKKESAIDQIDFESLIENCFQKMSFMNTADRIQKEVDVKIEVPFYSDSQRLDNLMSNLISNAIKYCDVNKEESYLKIAVETSSEKAFIEVFDNGVGIKKQHHDKIFDMFYRASVKSKGSGIGLYIVKEIVDKLHGQVSVESEERVGTTFRVEIPNIKVKEESLAYAKV